MAFYQQAITGIRRGIVWFLFELPANFLGLDRLIRQLEKSGQGLTGRVAHVKGYPRNQEVIAHIIGIERWGQRRLSVALGEPLLAEEYEAYRPSHKEWAQLQAALAKVRQETVSLCKSLRMAGVDPRLRVRHNQFGELSLLAWLFYLILHAQIESLRIL